jgi:hypothetical protein
VHETESPDFLIHESERVLGVEITVFHLPPEPGAPPHQEQQHLKDRIAATAEQIHNDNGGPGLYVTAVFRDSMRLRRNDVRSFSEALVEAVLSVPTPASIHETMEVPGDVLPPFVSGLLIHGSIDGQDRLWQADAGGWVASITPEQIQSVLEKKDRTVGTARTKCDELWLAVVEDPFSRGAPAKANDECLGHTYSSSFDRVLWLYPHGPRTVSLRLSRVLN